MLTLVNRFNKFKNMNLRNAFMWIFRLWIEEYFQFVPIKEIAFTCLSISSFDKSTYILPWRKYHLFYMIFWINQNCIGISFLFIVILVLKRFAANFSFNIAENKFPNEMTLEIFFNEDILLKNLRCLHFTIWCDIQDCPSAV